MEKKAPQWNEKELKMLKEMPLMEPVAIYDLAKACFKSVGVASNKRGNSWVRNSLRKPLRLKFIKQLGRGAYMKVKSEKPPKKPTAKKRSKKTRSVSVPKTSAIQASTIATTEATA